MTDLIDSRMGMLQTITHVSREQLDRAQAWAETYTDDRAVLTEIMQMLAQPPRRNVFSGHQRIAVDR